MLPKCIKGSVPPGFTKTLGVGEIPLMAASDHNRHPDSSKTWTYRMSLPGAGQRARGYHGLRFQYLSKIHWKKRWQRLAITLCVGAFCLLVVFWSQFTLPVLRIIKEVGMPFTNSPTADDIYRCGRIETEPLVIVDENEVALGDPGRAKIVNFWRENNSGALSGKLKAKKYLAAMTFFEIVVKLLKAHRVEFVLAGGSLVGSYMFHDMLPWDDSFDLAVRKGDLEKVRAAAHSFVPSSPDNAPTEYASESLLSYLKMAKPTLLFQESGKSSRHGMLSLNVSNASDDLDLPSLFVKLHWYSEQELSGYSDSNLNPASTEDVVIEASPVGGSTTDLKIPLNQWKPLSKRPFGLLGVPAPLNPLFYISRMYSVSHPYCQGVYNGFRGANPLFKRSLSCLLTLNAYPHVERLDVTDSCQKETYVFNNETRAIVYVRNKDTPAPEHSPWLFSHAL